MFHSRRLPVHSALVYCRLVYCLVLLVSAGSALGIPQGSDGSSCKMSLAQGYIEVRRAQVAAALEYFEEAIAGGGECLPEAHLGLATAYNSKNDHRRALKAAQTALLYAEDEEVLAAGHYQIGLVYDHRGPRMTKKKRQALAAFERALELSDGEHQGAMRAVFRISKETNNTERLTELEARYPGVQVATRAEQRRAVRPKKQVRKVKPSSREPEHGRIPPISVFATVDEGKLFDCATGLAIEAEEEQARLGEFSEGTRQVGEGITKPEKVSTSPPQYTREARKEKVQGVVIVQSVIDSAGEVRFVKVLKGLPLGLNREAIHAICHWKFKPARVADGSAVAVYYNLTVNFRLQ